MVTTTTSSKAKLPVQTTGVTGDFSPKFIHVKQSSRGGGLRFDDGNTTVIAARKKWGTQAAYDFVKRYVICPRLIVFST